LELKARGYYAVTHGQRTYNGVAILSKEEPQQVERGIEGYEDAEARVIAATIRGVRIVSVYVPNGQTVGTAKWDYKLLWLKHLRENFLAKQDMSAPLLICGDYNVAPDDRDVYNPKLWAKTVICHPRIREEYREVLSFGLVDTLRLYEDGPLYSWWDYRHGFDIDRGLRIDMILASEAMAKRCEAAGIDRMERAKEKPSDHVPIWARFREAQG
jgi:exodeoxyribonuclease-3